MIRRDLSAKLGGNDSCGCPASVPLHENNLKWCASSENALYTTLHVKIGMVKQYQCVEGL